MLESSSKDPKTFNWNFRNVYFIDRMTEDYMKNLRDKSENAKNPPPLPYFTSDIPEHLHMMNHVFRSAKYSKGEERWHFFWIIFPSGYSKSFIDPEKALIVYNHRALLSLEGALTSHEVMNSSALWLNSDQVDLDVGQLQHYRSYCHIEVNDCEESYLRHTVKDTSVWTWKDAVIRKSGNVLHKLGFLDDYISPPGLI